jgi:hypothetical protein
LFWDASAESLGIGTDSPDSKLVISEGASATGLEINPLDADERIDIYGFDRGSNVYRDLRFIADEFRVETGTSSATERFRIDSSGQILSTASEPTITLKCSDSSLGADQYIGGFKFEKTDGSGAGAGVVGGIRMRSEGSVGESTYLQFSTSSSSANDTERMRIDSSGNLLVGKTANDATTDGIQARGIGAISIARSSVAGDALLILNKKTNDGTIAEFRKDGTAVGSIGTSAGHLYVGNGDTNLIFNDTANSIYPWDSSANDVQDATVDLGANTARFKDLYLSGGAYLGGTAAANKLEDYEEGTFTPTFVITNCTVTHDIQQGNYTKVGNTVFFHLVIGTDAASGSFSGSNVLITGMPFATSRSQTGAVGLAHSWASELDDPSWSISSGTTVMSFYKSDNAAGLVLGAQLATGGNSNRLDITGSYHTDS